MKSRWIAFTLLLICLTQNPPTASGAGSSAGKIAFISTRDGQSDLYVIDMGASSRTPASITHNALPGEVLGEPTFSPDGTRIAFIAANVLDTYAHSDIYVIDVDGRHLTQLTHNGLANIGPAWSPDGTRIAYSCSVEGANPEICSISASGGTARTLTLHQWYELEKYLPEWSPDGKQIAFTWRSGMEWHIDVMNADGSNLRNIPSQQAEGPGGNPEWSPDGKRIAVAALNSNGIWVLNAAGADVEELTAKGSTQNSPDGPMLEGQDASWSPDGTQIVFGSPLQTNMPQSSDIYTVAPGGSHLLNLTNSQALNFNPVWSPNGRQIAFISTRDGSGDIYVMDADGTHVRRMSVNLVPQATGGYPASSVIKSALAWSTH